MLQDDEPWLVSNAHNGQCSKEFRVRSLDARLSSGTSMSVMRRCLIREARSSKYNRAIEGGSGRVIQKRAIRLLLLALLILARLNLLEPRLVESHAPVIIPFDDRVLFIRSLNRAKFPGRLSEVAQTLDTISGV
jgi:hypothetical protein